jgi:hypothetical protein
MKVVRLFVVGVVIVLAQAAPAHAYYDFPWLEKFSGPGPFFGVEVGYRFLCRVQPDPANADVTQAVFLKPTNPGAGLLPGRVPDDAAQRAATTPAARALQMCSADRGVRSHATAAFHFLRSTRNDLIRDKAFDNVTITGASLAYGVRIHPALDLSSSIGFSMFSGDAFERFSRLRLVPVDLKFYPFAGGRDALRSRAFAVTAGVVMYVPGFEHSDFCQLPNPEVQCANPDFSEAPELLMKAGVAVDLGALGALFRN